MFWIQPGQLSILLFCCLLKKNLKENNKKGFFFTSFWNSARYSFDVCVILIVFCKNFVSEWCSTENFRKNRLWCCFIQLFLGQILLMMKQNVLDAFLSLVYKDLTINVYFSKLTWSKVDVSSSKDTVLKEVLSAMRSDRHYSLVSLDQLRKRSFISNKRWSKSGLFHITWKTPQNIVRKRPFMVIPSNTLLQLQQ